jgi:hypothetical protein
VTENVFFDVVEIVVARMIKKPGLRRYRRAALYLQGWIFASPPTGTRRALAEFLDAWAGEGADCRKIAMNVINVEAYK